MIVVARRLYGVDCLMNSIGQATKRRLRSIVIHSVVVLSLVIVSSPVYSSTIGDPTRFASYNKPGLPSNRVMRGLGGPDRIERRNDGTSIFWYHWMVERQDGHIAARGMAAFSFAKDGKLDGFEISTMNEKGEYVDSTLDSVLNLATR